MTEQQTVYLDFTAREVMSFLDNGMCPWCGSNCPGDQCYARKCDCCTSVWKSNTLASVDDGHVLTEEDCPPCKIWMATMHLDNHAASFVSGDQ